MEYVLMSARYGWLRIGADSSDSSDVGREISSRVFPLLLPLNKIGLLDINDVYRFFFLRRGETPPAGERTNKDTMRNNASCGAFIGALASLGGGSFRPLQNS